MIKMFFLVCFGIMMQFLPMGMYQAHASHCSADHKPLPKNYHCHGKGQGTNDLDCHDHSGGLQAHQHGSQSQSKSKSDQTKK